MATLNQIATALRRADAAGDVEAATRLAAAYRKLEDDLKSRFEPPKEQAGFTGAFKDAVTTLGLTDEAAAFAANPTEENRAAFLKAAESKYKSVGGFGKGENWEAFKELLGGSLGALVAPLGAGVVGGIPGFAGVSGAQYGIQNLRRQAEEQQAAAEAGEAVPELSLGRAAAAATGQAALDVVPGALILRGLSKFPLAQGLMAEGTASRRAADVLADAFANEKLSLKGNVVKGVGLGVAFEVPQEIAQQALERWQAGLSLTDDEAKEEFKQAAIGAAVLGGGFGAIGGYGAYRGVQAEKAKEIEDARLKALAEERERAEIEESLFAAPAEGGIPAEFLEQARRRESDDIARSLLTRPTESGIPYELLEEPEQREARLENEAVQEERRQYSARTLREAAEAEALAPREDEGAPYFPPEEQVEEDLFPPSAEARAGLEFQQGERLMGDEDILEGLGAPTESGIPGYMFEPQAPSTEGVLEGLGAPTESGVPAEMFEPTPRELALEVIQVSPTIKAIAQATGLNQPKAAALMRQFVDEGIVEQKGNKFRVVTTEAAAEPEATDVSGPTVTTTETDTGAGGRSTDLFTLGSPAGELGAPPARGAGLDTAGDVTERVDDRERNVPAALEPLPTSEPPPTSKPPSALEPPPALETTGVLEGLGAPTESGLPPDMIEGYTAERARVSDLRTRALDFIRETGKGSAPDLQKALDIPLSEAKTLRSALLGTGAVVQKTNVKAAKTAGRSYFVTEGTYTPDITERAAGVERTTEKVDKLSKRQIREQRTKQAISRMGMAPYVEEETVPEAESRRREMDAAAELEAKTERKLPPTLSPDIGKGEYGLRYTDPEGATVYRAYPSVGERNEARAQIANAGGKDIATFSRMAEATKFELDYARRVATPAMNKAQVQRAVQGIRAGMSKLKTQLGLFTEEEAPTPQKPTPKKVTQKELVDYAKQVIVQVRDAGKLKKYSRPIREVLDAVERGDTDLRAEYKRLQRIETRLETEAYEVGEAKQARLEPSEIEGVEEAGIESADAAIKERDESYAPLDFRKLRFKRVRNPQIDTPQFKNWFGESKVVDSNGEPLVVYHGMPGEFEGETLYKSKYGALGEGIYFTSDPEAASRFAAGLRGSRVGEEPKVQGNVVPAYLKIERPFDNNFFVGNKDWQGWLASLIESKLKYSPSYYGPFGRAYAQDLLNDLKNGEATVKDALFFPVGGGETQWGKDLLDAVRSANYFDGIILEKSQKGFDEYLVFDNSQIKSAVGNVGTFSREDNRIRFQKLRSETIGMSADNVRTLVSNIISGWRNPPNFVVVQSYLDLPSIEGADPETYADSIGISIGNDVYIIADNVRSPRDLKATVFHESLGHYGLARLFGEQLFKVMLDIYNSNRAIAADADAWLEENPNTYPESQFTRDERRALAVEEILSEMSEAGPIQNMKWRAAFNRVAALIRKFARALSQLVGKNLAYSNTEVTDIITQAHNMVISGRTQLVPRQDNIRYMKAKHRKILTDAMRRVQSGAPSATKEILEGNINALDNLPSRMRSFKLSTFSLHHLMQLYEKYAPAFRRLNILVERMAKDASDLMVEHEKKAFKYREVLRNNPRFIDAFNQLANDINISQTPLLAEQLDNRGNFLRFVPDQAVIQRMRGIPANSAAYNALSPEDKVLHKAVQDFSALPADMQAMVADVFGDYRRYGDTAFQAKLEQFLNVLPPNVVAAIRTKYQGKRLKYYLPLRREGTYKLTYKTPDAKDVSEFYESKAAWEVGKEKAARAGGVGMSDEPIIIRENTYENGRPPTGLLKELSDNVAEALSAVNASTQTINDTQRIIFETFVDYMPGSAGNDLRQDMSSRQTWVFNGVTYYGRLGYNEDVVGVYESSVPRMLYRINAMKYTMPLEKVKEKISEQLKTYVNNKGAPQYAGVPDISTDYVSDLQSEVEDRIRFAKNPFYSGYVYTLSKANYIYSIALNISSALINTTIIPMMAWPTLAAKYGVINASRAVSQAMGMFFRNAFRDPATGRLTFNQNPSFGNGLQNQTAPHMQEFAQLHRMLEMRSVTGTSAEQELQQAQNINVPGYEGLSAKANLVMSYAFRSSERMNREVTALAAYMLARNIDANGQKFDPNRGQASVGRATEDAIRLNYDVNGATLPETNSGLYQTDIGRIVLTFRTHALNMIINLAMTFNQAVEKINVNEPNAANRKLLRSIARKKLLYVFGSTYMLAGIKGLPLFGAAEVLASMLMGDDDEPYDLEQEVLDAVGTLGLNGPINELLNVDIGSRTGFYGLLWRDDPKRLAEVGIPVYIMERIAGPTYGLVEAARRGFNDFAEGDIQRGFEAILPAPLRNPLKAMRYGIEGALTRDGLPIVEDVSAYNSMMQILGFAPADLAVAQSQRGATYEIGEKLKNRRVALLTNLYAARKAGNAEAVEKAMDDIRSFNEANPAYRIKGSTLRKSYEERERRAQQAVGGVFQPRSLRIATSEYMADLDEEEGLL